MIGVSRCAFGEVGGDVRGGAQVDQQRPERALGDEHRGGVDGVLAGRVRVHGRVGLRP